MDQYLVTRLPQAKLWTVSRLMSETEITRIGEFKSKREAVLCARLLAGWKGSVSIWNRPSVFRKAFPSVQS